MSFEVRYYHHNQNLDSLIKFTHIIKFVHGQGLEVDPIILKQKRLFPFSTGEVISLENLHRGQCDRDGQFCDCPLEKCFYCSYPCSSCVLYEMLWERVRGSYWY
jgi:hypothetical protein